MTYYVSSFDKSDLVVASLLSGRMTGMWISTRSDSLKSYYIPNIVLINNYN